LDLPDQSLNAGGVSRQKFTLNRIIFWGPRQEKALVAGGWIRLNHICRRVDRPDALFGEARLRMGLFILKYPEIYSE
jgi:hypothetical protein